MVSFLRRLRELDRYDRSAIVIHADHGNVTPCEDTRHHVPSEESSERMRAVALNGRSGRMIACLTRALLLVKPPGAPHAPLRISDRHTQLLDLRPTVEAMIGLPPHPGVGIDVLNGSFPRRRAVDVLEGSYRPVAGSAGTRRFEHLCEGIRSGELNHFVSDPDGGGWSVAPNVHVDCY
jgi:arylsulfatase A-like enzyme